MKDDFFTALIQAGTAGVLADAQMNGPADNEAAILKFFDDYGQAWKVKDAEAIANMHAADCTMRNGTETIHRPSVSDIANVFHSHPKQWTSPMLYVQHVGFVKPDVAVVYASGSDTTPTNSNELADHMPTCSMVVLRRNNGIWRMVATSA